jgi:hypothetical protein
VGSKERREAPAHEAGERTKCPSFLLFQTCYSRALSYQNKYERPDFDEDSHYYSSVFVKDGIKNYFTRLEQARKMKKEAEMRLGKLLLL